MKKIVSVLSILLIAYTSKSQNQNQIVDGTLMDIRQKPVVSATVTLMKLSDSSVFKMAISDIKGKFSFQFVPIGKYYIKVSAMNFEKLNSANFQISDSNTLVHIDVLTLNDLTQKLKDVIVSSKKPMLEQKLDRLVVNVESAVTNVGATALEVLEKSPGISVDKDGKIGLKGKSEVLLMVDSKPTYLSSAELATLLSNMSSNQISQIEIMTNPSAKFDASGNAGVINIKTKKSMTDGFNGSITLNYGQGIYSKSNNSILLNYRSGNLNAFLNYGYMLNNGFMKVEADRKFLNPDGTNNYSLTQLTNNISKSENNSLKLGIDYLLNPHTSIGIVGNGFIAPQTTNSETTSNLKDAFGNLSSIEKTMRSISNNWKNGGINLNFRSTSDKNQTEWIGNFDMLHYDFTGNQNVFGNTYNASSILQSESNLKNILPLKIDVYAAKLDYSSMIQSNIKLEAGLKSSVVQTNNASSYYNSISNILVPIDSLNNNFYYTENINAAYLNLNKKINNFNIQTGIRLENTNYHGMENSNLRDSSFKNSYLNLFPSLFLGYTFNSNHQIGISVGRRIDRPAYQQLNPFISIIDKYMQMSGNPFLKPQYSNSIELSYSFKNKFTTTLNYSIINDMMNETMSNKDSVILRSLGNIGTRYNLGISETMTIPITNWFTGIYFVNIYQNIYQGSVLGSTLRAKQLALSMRINNQFNFMNGWLGEISGSYTSRDREEGQAISLPIGQISIGVSKSFLNNKANIKFNIRDLFYTNTIREIQNFQDVQSNINRYRDSRVLNLALVWRFGMQTKSKQTQLTEEQKRIQMN